MPFRRPMEFIGYTFSEIRQSLVDMDVMLQVLAAPSPPATAAPDDANGRPTAAEDSAATATDLEATPNVAPLPTPRPAPTVAFEGVSFTYPNASTPALVDASFAAPAGGTTALVGVSGSGKSTCLRLLSRLDDVDAGRVLVDGNDVRKIPVAALRASIGFVPQEPWLADDTLLWNVQMGSPGATQAAIDAAVAAASLTTCVAQLPDGYGTRVGERGGRLSGGEKQRTVIARALLRGAPLLLADEPTASADALTEAAIVQSLRRGTSCGTAYGREDAADGAGGDRANGQDALVSTLGSSNQLLLAPRTN